jgi:S-methylmethionine-dependent homocysteine/selenocysteine methylase
MDEVIIKEPKMSNNNNNKSANILILDGGTGDFLQKGLGVKFDDETSWSACVLKNEKLHDKLIIAHSMFIQAGATAITTANFSVRKHIGFNNEEIVRLIQIATQLARQAIITSTTNQKTILLFGSLPPLLDCYRGITIESSNDGINQYIHMLMAFETTTTTNNQSNNNISPDAYLAETLNSFQEAQLVINAFTQCNIHKPLLISFCVKQDDGRLYSGEEFGDVIVKLLSLDDNTTNKIHYICLNCSTVQAIEIALNHLKPFHYELLLEKKCKLGVYPNRYTQISPKWTSLNQSLVVELGPKEFVQTCIRWIHSYHVEFIGGCCGIEPDFIQALAMALKQKS